MSDNTETEQLGSLEITDILKLLPHRYPFLLVDRIKDIEGGDRCTGIKNVTINEPFFQGHFPDFPIMPGVLIIEGMAQTAGVLCIHHANKDLNDNPNLVFFMSIDKARFRRPVVPGDTLHYKVDKVRGRGTVWRFKCQAYVEGKLVTEAEIGAMVVDKEKAMQKK